MKDKIEIYMCDDDQEYIFRAQQEIKAIAGTERELTFTVFDSGEEMIAQCKTHCADVLFLDIEMPGMNGFEVAETIQEFYNDVLIIFMTGYDHMVFHSFKYRPFWFVRKSHIRELDIVIPSLFEKLDLIYDNLNTVKYISVNNEIYEIDVKTLKMICSYRHHIFLMDETHGETKIRAKLQDVESQMSELHFVKIQKGVIINLRYVTKITSRKIIIKDGTDFNIGRERLQAVRNAFQRYIGSI